MYIYIFFNPMVCKIFYRNTESSWNYLTIFSETQKNIKTNVLYIIHLSLWPRSPSSHIRVNCLFPKKFRLLSIKATHNFFICDHVWYWLTINQKLTLAEKWN